MPANRDILFGKIAVDQGFCTSPQVDECIRMQMQLQSPHQPASSLGRLLIERGFLSEEQHGKVLALQNQNLDLVDPMVKKRREAALFGKLAVREGLLTEDEANECLRLQAMEGETRNLGEVMVQRGYLTADQVKELLGKQLKRIMYCGACKLSFTVLSLTEGKTINCPKCKAPLQDGKPTQSVRTDAEFSTQVYRAIKAGMPPPPQEKLTPRPTAKRTRVKCVICDHEFEALLDSTQRVQCPSCITTFTPKR